MLSREDAQRIERRVAAVEAATGVQVVAAVIGKSDSYPEIPWKAFALGAGLASLAVVVAPLLDLGGWTPATTLFHALAVLGSGAVCAVAAVLAPPFARLFLDRHRREAEVRQHAQSLFLAHELFRTRQRNGILLLVSRFERQVVLLPDAGIRARAAEPELAQVIAATTPSLRAGRFADALGAGLEALERLLASKGYTGGAVGDEIAEELIQEKGA